MKNVHPEQSEPVHDTYPIEQDAQNVIIDSLDMSNDSVEIDQNDDDINLAKEHELLASLIEKLKCEIDESKNRNIFLETSNKVLVEKLKSEIEVFKNKNKLASSNNQFKEANNKLSNENDLLYADYEKSQAELARRNSKEYALHTEIECAKVRGDLLSYKMDYHNSCDKYTKTINDLNQTISELQTKLSAHQETISILSKQKEAQIKLYKTHEDKEIERVIELENKVKLKGKYVDTKFEKSSVIRQPNAFKSQRPSVLGKPTTFSNSFIRKDFSKSTLVTQNNVSNDFSKPVTAQTLRTNKKPCLKNTNVLAPGMYKLHTYHTRTRTSQLPRDSKKANKRVSFSTGVIPTTSVSRPQLKSNPQGDRVIPQLKSNPHGDRVLRSNSRGKKLEVEEHRRNVKLPKNKMSVTACNDSLNAKTLHVKSVSAMCVKCVLIDKHD
nr:hypothetical protein [Tanacetum cinerariifolium]